MTTHHEGTSLADLIRARAASQPDRLAYSFLVDGERDEQPLRYAALDLRGRAIGAHLQALGARGQRVVVAILPGLDYLTAFYGCLYAGAVAVPVYPPSPGRRDHAARRLRTLIEYVQPAAVLYHAPLAGFCDAVIAQAPGLRASIAWTAVEAIGDDAASAWREPGTRGDSLAILQCTSGSTGAPKAVMLTHDNLARNSTLIQQCIESSPDSRLVAWLPPYHDLGLIGAIVHPLYVGFPSTMMSPAAFLRRPLRWLQAMSRLGATISGAPSFAYQLCVREIPPDKRAGLDLSRWSVAVNGSEPIAARWVEAFADAYAPYGFRREAFRAAYGLAESTLFVTASPRQHPLVVNAFDRAALERGAAVASSPAAAGGRALAGCGRAQPGQTVIAVDPETRTECGERQIGEIWAADASVSPGYWNRDDDSARTFGATLAGGDGRRFLRTGDLGFFDGGELYITGRIKDVVIVRGRNHDPSDLELTVETSHPALRPAAGAAFCVEIDGEERLAVVQEVKGLPAEDTVPGILAAIRKAVVDVHEINPHAIVLVQPGAVPKTSSGKIARHACRQAFLDGSLAEIGDWRARITAAGKPEARPVNEVAAWMVSQLSHRLGLPAAQIDVREPFAGYGLDSKEALALAGELETWIGRPISPALIWDYPTIESFSRYLVEGPTVTASEGARPLPAAEPIAIIGYACRLPGGPDPEALWRLLRDGKDAIVETPPDRWDNRDYYDPNPDAPGKMTTRWGGFLPDVAGFEAGFFGISPREADRMDPQQRLLMEVTWEALDCAGMSPERIAGSRTAVFVGIGGVDYSQKVLKFPGSRWKIDAHVGTGNTHSIAANRLSYALDLRGPSLALDTACSSSLVAVHLACQSLAAGESAMALAGGVNLILSPEVSLSFSHARMLAPDGRCKTFDATADGYVRAEGSGMLLLKPLSQALRDRDPIHALIRGSAANQDGRTPGITAPSGLAQQAVIRTALDRAGLTADQLSYVEAHGTGTRLGDPIEIRALAEVIGPRRSEGQRCHVGSLKANIGHTETVSGVAGLIKVILCLQHGELPPQIHLQEINPLVRDAIEGTPLVIARDRTPWPSGSPRYAGVSSFGFGGMNAHIIVGDPPRPLPPRRVSKRSTEVLCLSARSATALKAVVQRQLAHMAEHPGDAIQDLCFSLNTGRAHHTERLAVIGSTAVELRGQLEAFAAGRNEPGMWTGHVGAKTRPKVAFLFTGQGAQYPGMGRALYDTHPAFRAALDRCAEILDPLLPAPLLAVMYHDPALAPRIHDTAFTQPALFALEYALATLWMSWGVEPAALLGHSVGEYVAATLAGVFPLEAGLALIAERGRLMASLPAGGKMAAVFADEAALARAIEPFAGEVAIAAINGPASAVVSGAGPAVARIVEALEAQGVRTQALTVSHAFHSPLMDGILDAFEARAREVAFRAPALPLISNLTGRRFADGEVPDAAYWRRHLRGAVRFADGMAALLGAGQDVFLEIGPSPTLTALGRRCAPGGRGTWLASLREGKDDWKSLTGTLAGMFVTGVAVDWSRFHGDGDPQRRMLPSYPFERERHWWLDFFEARDDDAGGHTERAARPLLGHRVRSSLSTTEFEAVIGIRGLPFLADHQVQGAPVYPAAGYLSAVHAAACTLFGDGVHTIADVAFQQALFLPADGDRVIHTVVNPATAGETSFAITSLARDSGQWTQHVTGRIRIGDGSPAGDRAALAAIRERCSEQITADELYAWIESRGMFYGPLFRGVQRMWRRDGEGFGEVRLPPVLDGDLASFPLHPVLLDACMHVASRAIPAHGIHARSGNTYLPARLAGLRMLRPASGRVFSHVTLTSDLDANLDVVVGDMRIYDEAGELLIEMLGLELARFGRSEDSRATTSAGWIHQTAWREKPAAGPATPPADFPQTWVLLADRSVAEDLMPELTSRGYRCVLARRGAAYRADDHEFVVRPGEPADLKRLLEDAARRFGQPVAAVVHLWSLEIDPEAEPTVAARTASEDLVELVQVLVQADAPPRLWLVTRNAQPVSIDRLELAQAPLLGLGRVIALEHPELRAVRIDMTATAGGGQALAREITTADGEDEVALRASGRWVPRITRRSEPDEARPADGPIRLDIPRSPVFHLATSKAGKLDNLVLRPAPQSDPGDGQIEIDVRAAGLNFRDLMNAMGLYPGKPIPFGAECAGVITRIGPGVHDLAVGDRVMAIAPDAFGNRTVTHALAAQRIPSHLSFEEAATIPITFLTAHYGLNHLARMTRGELVLIHSGAGGVGLAALQLAQLAGAEIFATAGTPEKRSFLEFVGAHHALDSRSLDFADEIMRRTGGRGVDIALNSLPGEYIAKTLACLAPYGRFLEIGRVDIYLNRQLSLYPFHNNLSYHAIDLDRVCRERAELSHRLFAEIAELFERRQLKPLPRRAFPIQETVDAFRYMAQRKNIGKVVITVDRTAEVAAAVAPGSLRGDASYLITGGLGGLGLTLARWMASRGARHLALLGRSPVTAAQQATIDELERSGTRVVAVRCDVADAAQLAAALAELRAALPPLRGVIHAAGVLDDGLLVNLDRDRMRGVLAPKIDGAWNLHTLTASDPLDLFVMFSSVASVLGSPGQGNYAAGNAFLDGLAQLRRQGGRPALAINWGPWDEVGMAARSDKRARVGKLLDPMAPRQALEALGTLLASDATQTIVVDADWHRLRQLRQGHPAPLLEEVAGGASPAPAAGTLWNRAELVALPRAEQPPRVIALLQAELAKVMGVAAEVLQPDRSLRSLGLDSLMGLEMKESIESGLHIAIPISALLEDVTIADLAAKVVELLGGGIAAAPERRAAAEQRAGRPIDSEEAQRLLSEIDNLPPDQVDSLLSALMPSSGDAAPPASIPTSDGDMPRPAL